MTPSPDIRRFEQAERQYPTLVFGKPGTAIETFLIDSQTHTRITDDTLYNAFHNLTATGYYVKAILTPPLYDPHPYISEHNLPTLGIVTDITSTDVLINNIPIPRAIFHYAYEID